MMRTNQTYDYVQRMKAKYLTFEHPMMVFDAMLELNNLVDSSDPDLALPNIQHLFQTAEGLRSEGRPDWMVLVGLLHGAWRTLFARARMCVCT